MSENQVWIFAYGSLMWRPDFEYFEEKPARLFGYHRALCIFSHFHRGTQEKPWLVFGLDKGGSCKGIAYRIRKVDKAKIFTKLHQREMPTKVYVPMWLPIHIGTKTLRAYGFVADRKHKQYAAGLSEEEVIQYISQGVGGYGTCHDYVENTLKQLSKLGIQEHQLRYLVKKATPAYK